MFENYNNAVAATQAASDSQMAQQHASDLLTKLTTGAGLGMGGMALYHLAHALRGSTRKERKAQKYQNLATRTPAVKAANDGVGEALRQAPEQLGGFLKNLFTSDWGSGATGKDPNLLRGSLATTLGIAAGLGGMYGGGKLVNTIMDNKRKADAEDEVEAARQNYYAALTGKTAAALDKAYEKFEKQALLDYIDPAARFLLTANMLASLGAAGIGARYMYKRTTDRARGDNLAKAQASRARMKGLPTVWMDPEQIAADVSAAKQVPAQSSNE